MSTALIVVDVQNDFCEGGSLAVRGASVVAVAVSALVAAHRHDHVVATKDWHDDPGAHFSDTPDYVDTWPVHCVAGTTGADLHEALRDSGFDAVFVKGRLAAAYSGFEGSTPTEGGEVGLAQWLRERGVDAVDVVGIATDHCVRATALDAVREGFITHVLLDLTAGVAAATTERALQQLGAAGVQLVGRPVVLS